MSSIIRFELAEAIPTNQLKPFDLFRRAFLFSGNLGLRPAGVLIANRTILTKRLSD